jgi:hypothetical protein
VDKGTYRERKTAKKTGMRRLPQKRTPTSNRSAPEGRDIPEAFSALLLFRSILLLLSDPYGGILPEKCPDLFQLTGIVTGHWQKLTKSCLNSKKALQFPDQRLHLFIIIRGIPRP